MKMDMWQAGVTLFMMLTKEYPFDLRNISDCLTQMRDNKPNLEGKIQSTNIRELLQRLLNKEPSERPTAKEVLQYPWLLSIIKEKEDEITLGQDSDLPESSR